MPSFCILSEFGDMAMHRLVVVGGGGGGGGNSPRETGKAQRLTI